MHTHTNSWGWLTDQLQSPVTVRVTWYPICWFASIEKSLVIHDTEWPYRDQVSLNKDNMPNNLTLYRWTCPPSLWRTQPHVITMLTAHKVWVPSRCKGVSDDVHCTESSPHVHGTTLWGDKVSMLTHIYPHKPWRDIEVTICKHQADSPHYVWLDVWSADLHLFIKNMVIHDTKCPYWDQVSLHTTNKPNV